MKENKYICPFAANGRESETKVMIDKWRLDSLIEDAESCLKAAGKTVGSTAVAADYPQGAEEHDFAIRDAANCYGIIASFVEMMRYEIKRGAEAVF